MTAPHVGLARIILWSGVVGGGVPLGMLLPASDSREDERRTVLARHSFEDQIPAEWFHREPLERRPREHALHARGSHEEPDVGRPERGASARAAIPPAR